jgi:hypothetical protein
VNKQVDRAWELTWEKIEKFQNARKEDRHWHEIWPDAPRASVEADELIAAAVKVQEAVDLIASAHARAVKRGGPVY